MRASQSLLKQFYQSPLGEVARRMAQARIGALWPRSRGLDVLGFGYALPFVDGFMQARRVALAVPCASAGEAGGAGGRLVLTQEDRLPFPDALFDRVLVVHALEEAESLRASLRELWRVTAPEGRLMAIVANRRGLWARSEITPFGRGRSFSQSQLSEALENAMFLPQAWARALYAPPVDSSLVLNAADLWERAGEVAAPRFGGLLMVEAIKRLHAGPKPIHGRAVEALAPRTAMEQA